MHPMNSNAQSARSNYVKKESKTKKQQLKSNRSKNHKEKTTTIEHRESEKRRMHTIPKTNERRKKASNQINKIKKHDALIYGFMVCVLTYFLFGCDHHRRGRRRRCLFSQPAVNL